MVKGERYCYRSGESVNTETSSAPGLRNDFNLGDPILGHPVLIIFF